MSKIMRIAVLAVSLMSLFLVMSSAASAVTWTNNTDTTFTATAGPHTLTVTTVPLACGSAHATGTAPMAVSDPLSIVATGTIGYGCTITALRNLATVDCSYSLTATALDGVGATSTVTGIADVTCGIYQAGTKICHIDGALPVAYTNPNTGSGILHIPASTRLTTTNAAGTCPLAARDVTHLTALTFRVIPSAGGSRGPTIIRH
jgi:hypothetical protein